MSDTEAHPADLKGICGQVASAYTTGGKGFRPTANQVCFFTSVWWLKKGNPLPPENPLSGQVVTAVTERAGQVAQHLDEWGPAVTGLKCRDEVEWELLRIQMEKAVRYYACPPELKADALQEALIKVFRLLDKVFDGHKLDETQDLVALVVEAQDILTNIYDFGSPFYAFAKRIARNELLSELRKRGIKFPYSIPLDDVADFLPADPVLEPAIEDDDAVSRLILQLTIDLAMLLEIIQHNLPLKRRLVALYTLAARPRFWRALEITGLSPPKGTPPKNELATDEDIAQALETNVNNVRVHRREGRKQISEVEKIVGYLFEGLVTRKSDSSARRKWRKAKDGEIGL